MNKQIEMEYLNLLISECDSILHTCLFDPKSLKSGDVASCMADCIQTLTYVRELIERGDVDD